MCVHRWSGCDRQGSPVTTHVGSRTYIYARNTQHDPTDTTDDSCLDSVSKYNVPNCITSHLSNKKKETLNNLKLNPCYELRLQSIEGLMFLHLGFINYYTTSAVFFFIDDSCFSDVVQCIKSKRLTLSDGLIDGLEKHTGQRKQPMCSNAVSLFSVIAIIICQHPVVGCMLCFGILKNLLQKAWLFW